MRLTDEQHNAVHQPGHVCLVSCPGSGKTRAIVAKLLKCIDDVQGTTRRAICITHTNAAADEIDTRLRQMCFGDEDAYYEVATIHAFALQNIVRPFHQLLAELKNGFTVLTSDSETYKSKVQELIQSFQLQAFAAEEFEGIHRSPNGYIYPSQNLHPDLEAEWCSWLDQNAYVTLNDIVYHAGRLILSHDHIASAVASRFAWILVDEFQDSSPVQIAILEAIHKFQRTTFFCVGDPNQSIYRFAGADPELLTNFAALVKANTSHQLTGNFRSSKHIINVAERLCSSIPQMQPVGRNRSCELVPAHFTVSGHAEAILKYFLPEVRKLGVSLGNVAILAPWWHVLFHLARELRKQGIPIVGPGARPYKGTHLLAQLVEAVGAYLESPEPEIAIAMQRALYILLANLTGHPLHNVFDYHGRVLICKFLDEAQKARTANPLAVNWLTDAAQRFSRLLIESEFLSASAASSIIESAAQMVEDINRRDGGSTLKIEDLGIFARPKNCIQILTIHKAKGREFEAVAVIDVRDGTLPHFAVSKLSDPVERQAQYDESRRVVYVAATRAKRLLMFFTDISNLRNRPSPFLAEMGF